MLEAEIVLQPTSPLWTRVENGEPYLRLTGAWWGVVDTQASGLSYARTNQSGAKAEITFHGTRVALVSFTGMNMGRAKLTLDGGSPIYVDLYDVEGGSETVWTSGTLENEPHTLEIEWTGFKHPEATDTIITIDAVDVNGILAI